MSPNAGRPRKRSGSGDVIGSVVVEGPTCSLRHEPAADVVELVRRTRKQQGLPATVADQDVLRRVADIVVRRGTIVASQRRG